MLSACHYAEAGRKLKGNRGKLLTSNCDVVPDKTNLSQSATQSLITSEESAERWGQPRSEATAWRRAGGQRYLVLYLPDPLSHVLSRPPCSSLLSSLASLTSSCISLMTDTEFQIYTQFKVHVFTICDKLTSNHWRKVTSNHIEALTKVSSSCPSRTFLRTRFARAITNSLPLPPPPPLSLPPPFRQAWPILSRSTTT